MTSEYELRVPARTVVDYRLARGGRFGVTITKTYEIESTSENLAMFAVGAAIAAVGFVFYTTPYAPALVALGALIAGTSIERYRNYRRGQVVLAGASGGE